jgi:hypothetical protein
MPGPVMTIREAYQRKNLRPYIAKRGPFYYVKQQAGAGYTIMEKGKVKKIKITGSTKVWHRGKGHFSLYTSRQDRKIKRPYKDFSKGYLHTGDKPRKKK